MNDTLMTMNDILMTMNDILVTMNDMLMTMNDILVTMNDMLMTMNDILMTMNDILMTMNDILMTMNDILVTMNDMLMTMNDILMTMNDILMTMNDILVGGFIFFIIFPCSWDDDLMLQSDELIFFRGVGIPPTRYWIIGDGHDSGDWLYCFFCFGGNKDWEMRMTIIDIDRYWKRLEWKIISGDGNNNDPLKRIPTVFWRVH